MKKLFSRSKKQGQGGGLTNSSAEASPAHSTLSSPVHGPTHLASSSSSTAAPFISLSVDTSPTQHYAPLDAHAVSASAATVPPTAAAAATAAEEPGMFDDVLARFDALNRSLDMPAPVEPVQTRSAPSTTLSSPLGGVGGPRMLPTGTSSYHSTASTRPIVPPKQQPQPTTPSNPAPAAPALDDFALNLNLLRQYVASGPAAPTSTTSSLSKPNTTTANSYSTRPTTAPSTKSASTTSSSSAQPPPTFYSLYSSTSFSTTASSNTSSRTADTTLKPDTSAQLPSDASGSDDDDAAESNSDDDLSSVSSDSNGRAYGSARGPAAPGVVPMGKPMTKQDAKIHGYLKSMRANPAQDALAREREKSLGVGSRFGVASGGTSVGASTSSSRQQPHGHKSRNAAPYMNGGAGPKLVAPQPHRHHPHALNTMHTSAAAAGARMRLSIPSDSDDSDDGHVLGALHPMAAVAMHRPGSAPLAGMSAAPSTGAHAQPHRSSTMAALPGGSGGAPPYAMYPATSSNGSRATSPTPAASEAGSSVQSGSTGAAAPATGGDKKEKRAKKEKKTKKSSKDKDRDAPSAGKKRSKAAGERKSDPMPEVHVTSPTEPAAGGKSKSTKGRKRATSDPNTGASAALAQLRGLAPAAEGDAAIEDSVPAEKTSKKKSAKKSKKSSKRRSNVTDEDDAEPDAAVPVKTKRASGGSKKSKSRQVTPESSSTESALEDDSDELSASESEFSDAYSDGRASSTASSSGRKRASRRRPHVAAAGPGPSYYPTAQFPFGPAPPGHPYAAPPAGYPAAYPGAPPPAAGAYPAAYPAFGYPAYGAPAPPPGMYPGMPMQQLAQQPQQQHQRAGHY